ncbi:hypothetical protein KB553_06670 [Chryseobacterium rhizoplanae]|uniref:hypothetical protein n=1 Tax=Chryseobacterium rhizoplanae TaxID=1609531 RepID=UPI001CE3624F|nr:hypothetical protein [Chryseobacterium rhizoplanae]UCA61209.1 hypothetical protein KB553_06670 [Chryseobacterium rhizoplanae]
MKEKIISNTSKFVFDKIVNYVEPKIRQTFENRVIEYTTSNAKSFSYIKTILHKDSVNLSLIYHPLKIYHKNNDQKSEINNFKNFINKHNKVSLIASGGSGKTTFIKHFYIECVTENYKIPVLFNFRDFNQFNIKGSIKDKNISENYIFRAFTKHLIFNKVGIDSATLEKFFDSGEFIFFLDGYDELDNEIKNIITKDFRDFVNRFGNNKFIITTRPYTSANYLEDFDNIYLSGLDNSDEIKSFIKKQLYNNQEFANVIIKTLESKSSTKYSEILSNPLFLILFINSFESYPKIPPKKTQFYWQVFDALFEKHETFSKTGYRRPKLSKIDRETFEKVLNMFSYMSYFQEIFSFTEFQFESIIRAVRAHYRLKLNAVDFLTDLKISVSILVEDGNILSFIHRSIQEYFAARFLNELSENDKADFLVRLAKTQNKSKNGHTFLIELISELHPYEFKKYYIRNHIEEFYNNKEYYLTEHTTIKGYDKVFDSFENFKLILSYSPEFKKIFNNFMKSHNFMNENINIIISANTKKKLKLAQEILTLYENKNKFYIEMSKFIKAIDDSNKPLIDFAFKTFNTNY